MTTVLDVVPGASARAQWDLTGDEAFFAGHFPGRPTLPGVLMVAALARVATLGLSDGDEERPVSWSLEKARFRRQVFPGESLVLDVSLENAGDRSVRARGVAAVAGEPACQATIVLTLEPSS